MKPRLFSARLIELDPASIGLAGSTRIFTTLEGQNPGGSIKDYMVWGELTEKMEKGFLRPGDRVSEVSAGSTAKSLAHYCRVLGLKCSVFVPNNCDPELLRQLGSMGAEIIQVAPETAFSEHDDFVRRTSCFAFRQLHDESKLRHYLPLGVQIASFVPELDLVLGAVGTGHSLRGVAAGIGPRARVITAEPESSEVPGIRNLDTHRHGPDDPCTPDLFSKRILVKDSDFFAQSELAHQKRRLVFPRSFQVALGALKQLARSEKIGKVLVLGAANRLI